MSEARQQASDVVACLELLVNVAEQIMRGHEPWAEVAVASPMLGSSSTTLLLLLC
jgi:hypothetical protein